jgi:hypothetical protein
LGLAVVKMMAEAPRVGEDVKSILGEGAKFSLGLPLA